MKTQKYLIFDAGPLISMTMNGILYILERLKENFDGEFVITPSVKREVVDRALNIKKYSFEAVQIKDLLDRKILRMSSDFVKDNELSRETAKIISKVNGVYSATGEKISPIQEGEASCLAFANVCNCENLIVIDERTTRLLTESPENVRTLLERKLHMRVKMRASDLKDFSKYRFIRSSELVFVAYKKKLFKLKSGPQLLDALLYGLKYKGTSISSKEIKEMKKLA